MLHELLSRLPPSQVPAVAAMLGCTPEVLREAIHAKPGYRTHSIALHQVDAVLRDEPMPTEPWPDGVDPTPVVEHAAAILAGLRACWSRIPSESTEGRAKVVVVPCDDREAMKDLRRLAIVGIREVVFAETVEQAEQMAAEIGADVLQIGWAPGLIRTGGKIMGIEEWAR